MKKDEENKYWRFVEADRVAFLFDAADYFAALYATLRRAKRSIFIVGWEIDANVELFHDDEARELPTALGALLGSLVEREPELLVRLLPWDYVPLGLGEHLLAPLLRSEWPDHERLQFQPVAARAPTASLHEKIVVVDDAVAFCGGMDLTAKRWDTSEHRADDPRRRDYRGEPYYPWHDVQAAVDGEAALALGDLCRERWHHAVGETPPRTEAPSASDPWPPGIPVDVRDAQLGISRTVGGLEPEDSILEIEALYLHAIRRARRFIYIENQYSTSSVIGEALAARLEERGGPEVVLVLPEESDGWLEEGLMSSLRARVLNRLEQADRYNRLRVYSPTVPDIGNAHVDVHSKVLVVDGKLLSLGSANVSNRSMSLDNECNLTLDAGRSRRRSEEIAAVFYRLLAEHLGRTRAEVAASMKRSRSLIATIDGLSRPGRALVPLSNVYPGWVQDVAPSSTLTDPEGPVGMRRITEGAIPGRLSDLTNDPILKLAVVLSGVSLAGFWLAIRKLGSRA